MARDPAENTVRRPEATVLPKKVLLAVDGSPDAAVAARAAADVCEVAGAELHVAHAWHTVPTARLQAFMRAELRRIGEEVLEEQVSRLGSAGVDVAAAHLLEGRASDEILDLSERIEAGMIVVGSRGRGGVERLILGSVSEAVVHHARCPVLVLRGGGTPAWPPERVLFAEDGSEASRAAGDLAAALCGGLAARGEARGLVMRVYPRLPEKDAEGREFDPRAAEDDLRREDRALSDRADELARLLGSRPNVRVAVGDPARELLEAASEEVPERTLVALGSRGLGAMGRMRLGSVSTKVLRTAQGPILVHPSSDT